MAPSADIVGILLLMELLKNSPANFKIRLVKGNSVVNQFVHVDPGQKIETFHVLPFDTVDESVILHDFNKNWTLILLPKKKQCFIKPLTSGVPTPQQLKSSIQQIISSNNTNHTAGIDVEENSSWKVSRLVTINRKVLSQQMQRMCAGFPIWLIHRIRRQLSITQTTRTGRSTRYSTRNACGGRVCNWVTYRVFVCDPVPFCGWSWRKEMRCRTIQC